MLHDPKYSRNPLSVYVIGISQDAGGVGRFEGLTVGADFVRIGFGARLYLRFSIDCQGIILVGTHACR